MSVRSDGKIFATAEWDLRFRVFSGKRMKELVDHMMGLKLNGVGCYAVAFNADVLDDDDDDDTQNAELAGEDAHGTARTQR